MNCDVFISYRRDGGDMAAMHIYQALKDRGYNVFYDLEVLRSGKFNESLLEAIQSCTDYVLILSPHALDRCTSKDDWVRQEIAEALRLKKNIIPVMMNGFVFPETLPEDIDGVRLHNGLSATTEYFAESIDRLCNRYLKAKPQAKKGNNRVIPVIGLIALIAALVVFFSQRNRTGTEHGAIEVPNAAETAVITGEPVTTKIPSAVPEMTASQESSVKTTESSDQNSVQTVPLSEMDLPVMRGDFDVEFSGSDEAYKAPVFKSQWERGQIQKIVFTTEPAGDGAWDVSEAEDGSILMQVSEIEGKNVLSVHANPAVRMPESTNLMFIGYTALEEIEWNGMVDFSKTISAANMFDHCENLGVMDLRGLDFRRLEDASGMFFDCQGLRKLHLEGVRMDSLTNMNSMFEMCTKLETLDLSGMDTSRVTSMGAMFQFCESLRELDVSMFDTSRVTNMSAAFAFCRNLETLHLGDLNTSRVTAMAGMFAQDSRLRELDVSGFDTSRVDDMNNMFASCSSLLELDVSRFDTSRVTDMSHMFESCQNILTLNVRGFNTEMVTDMRDLFADCISLDELDLSGWKTEKVSSMAEMFRHCRALKKLDLSGFDLSSVESMHSMFADCEQLTDIGVDPGSFGKGDTTDMYLNSGLAAK